MFKVSRMEYFAGEISSYPSQLPAIPSSGVMPYMLIAKVYIAFPNPRNTTVLITDSEPVYIVNGTILTFSRPYQIHEIVYEKIGPDWELRVDFNTNSDNWRLWDSSSILWSNYDIFNADNSLNHHSDIYRAWLKGNADYYDSDWASGTTECYDEDWK